MYVIAGGTPVAPHRLIEMFVGAVFARGAATARGRAVVVAIELLPARAKNAERRTCRPDGIIALALRGRREITYK